MTGAAQLRRHLTAQKLTQAEFAAQAGVSTASVSLWLSGLSRPGYESALLIQSATGGAVPFAAWRADEVPPATRAGKPEPKPKGGGSKGHARKVPGRAA